MMNAYTAQTKTTANGVTTATGPDEVPGPWSLRLKDDGIKADFSAALNMGFSDGWVLMPTGGSGNLDPAARSAHTHHTTVVDGQVTAIANGFQVTGTAMFTLNGGPAPVVIEITGGDKVEFSNMTLTFGSPGLNHFGAEALPGVVRSVEER